MKKSMVFVFLLFLAFMVKAQQPFEKQNKLSLTNKPASSSLSLTTFEKFVFDSVTSFSMVHRFDEMAFNHYLFNRQLASIPLTYTGGKLMLSLKETLSHTGHVLISNKRFIYTTGMTGKGVGLKLSL